MIVSEVEYCQGFAFDRAADDNICIFITEAAMI